MTTDALLKDRRSLVISGSSGTGKGTLINKLLAKYPGILATTVSHTTRQPRANELNNQAYVFVSDSAFLSLVSQSAFVEWAFVNGNHYGTSKQTLVEQTAKGSVVILDIDIQGAKIIQAEPGLEARFVFIKSPSLENLRQRLRDRGTESEENIRERLDQARAELEEADRSNFYEISIVNGDLDVAFQELMEFIFA